MRSSLFVSLGVIAKERKAIHALVDRLPARELPTAKRFLEFLRRSPAEGNDVAARGPADGLPPEVEGLFTLDWAEADS